MTTVTRVMVLRLVTALVAMWCISQALCALDYPTKTITIIVPFSAGGGTDVQARQIAKGLSARLGKPVVIDNRPGAGGQIADASTTVYFGPKQPDGVKRGNWIQTMPDKRWFIIPRLYGPLEPFFDKSWRPSEIEPVPMS